MYGTYCRLHVLTSASYREVVRQAFTKIAPHHRRAPAMREERKKFYRVMLDHHAEARRPGMAALDQVVDRVGAPAIGWRLLACAHYARGSFYGRRRGRRCARSHET